MSGPGDGRSEREWLASRPSHERLRITDDILPNDAVATVFDVDGGCRSSVTSVTHGYGISPDSPLGYIYGVGCGRYTIAWGTLSNSQL
jgi:hypothetical protein